MQIFANISFTLYILNINVQTTQLLNTHFEFKVGALLKSCISEITGLEKTFFALEEILTKIKEIVGNKELLDDQDPSVILCSEELEGVLDRKDPHVS